MQRLTVFYIFILIAIAFSIGLHEHKVMAQSMEWSNYKSDTLDITFDYPSSWTMTEKTNRFEQGSDLSVSSGQQIFTYTAPTMNIQYFDAYVTGLSIGLNIGIPYSNLQIVDNYNLNEFQIDGQPTATALYAYNLGSGERVAEQEYLVYKDYQVHTLKFRDSASSFDSPENQAIRDHMINSFHFIESPLRELEKLDRASSIDPEDYWTLRQKSSLLYELGNYSEAIDVYDKILKLGSEVKDYSRDAVLKEKGLALYHLGKYKDSIETFESAIFGGNVYPEWMIGNNYVALGNLTGAISWYDRALEKFPDDISNLQSKGEALEKLGRYDDALVSYDKALQVNSTDPKALLSKGNLLNLLGQYDESVSYFDRILSQNPNDVATLDKKGFLLYTLENYTKAIESYDKILELEPSNYNASIYRGVALYAMGNYTEAINQFDKILDIHPHDYMAWSNKGLSLSQLGNYTEAIKLYDKALFMNPENYILYDNKGYSLFKLGKIDEAIQLASKSISLNHDYANAWYNLAIYSLEKNKTDESLSNLRNAFMLDQDYLNQVIEDKDFDKIRNNTNFIKLVEDFKSGT